MLRRGSHWPVAETGDLFYYLFFALLRQRSAWHPERYTSDRGAERWSWTLSLWQLSPMLVQCILRTFQGVLTNRSSKILKGAWRLKWQEGRLHQWAPQRDSLLPSQITRSCSLPISRYPGNNTTTHIHTHLLYYMRTFFFFFFYFLTLQAPKEEHLNSKNPFFQLFASL